MGMANKVLNAKARRLGVILVKANMIIAIILFCSIGISSYIFAQEPNSQSAKNLEVIKKDIQALKEGQKWLKKDLDEIKAILRNSQRASGMKPNPIISMKSEPALGKAAAKVIVVEFSDYECPFCARHSQQTLPLSTAK